ncbi:MAG TPA: anti-sigma factor antagonist [Gammaproteobacteria bacterium]|nr:anti-sigma factor antagonist [Gammaproteobacteria bacterium]
MSVSSAESDNGNQVNIIIKGRFDFNDHTDFRESYRPFQGDASYTLDMHDAEYMDSSALGMLLLLREHAGGDNAKINVVGCRPEIKKILAIANFQKLFDIE